MPTALWSDHGQVTVISAGWGATQMSQDPSTGRPWRRPIRDHTQHEGHENCNQGHSRTRDRLDRQLELDRACSKSRAYSRACRKSHRWSKSHKRSKSRKHSKSQRCSKSRGHSGHEVRNPECGRPSKHAAQAGDALRKIGPTDHQVPVPTVTSRTEMLGMPHIRCLPKMKCPNSWSSRRR